MDVWRDAQYGPYSKKCSRRLSNKLSCYDNSLLVIMALQAFANCYTFIESNHFLINHSRNREGGILGFGVDLVKLGKIYFTNHNHEYVLSKYSAESLMLDGQFRIIL